MHTYHLSVWAFLLIVFIGLYFYYKLLETNRDLFMQTDTYQGFLNLISHIPNSKFGPGQHILAGFLVIIGFAGLLALTLSDYISSGANFFSNAISLGSLFIGLAFSTISLWTLWQARKLEFQQGFKIASFEDLIRHLNEEMKKIRHSYTDIHNRKAQKFHRVYLVTTQPLLGSLSYPTSQETEEFTNNLRNLAEYAAEPNDGSEGFTLEVMCGTDAAIDRFHSSYDSGSKDVNDRLGLAKKKVTNLINKANTDASSNNRDQPFTQVDEVPPVQFMIIGSKLFEFTLESGNTVAEIFNTQVVTDERYCRAYIENFNILKRALKNISH